MINRRATNKTVLVILFFLLQLPGISVLTAAAEDLDYIELLSAEETRWLTDNPDKLILWYDMYYPPIEFHGEDDAFEGIGADVMKLIEDRLGVDFIRKPSSNWNLQLESLRTGESAIAPVIVPSDERREYALFSKPYISIPAVIITARGSDDIDSLQDLTGQRVAVVSGFVSEEYLENNYGEMIEIVAVDSIVKGLNDVSFGVVDAMLENIAVAAYYIEKEKLPNLEVAGHTDLIYYQSFGVSREYPLLFSAMNKVLNTIPSGEIQRIENKWIHLERTGLSREQRMMLFFGGAVLAVALIFMVFFSWFLKRSLSEKQLALARSEKALREKSERLQLTLDLANDGLWDLNLETGVFFLSPRFYTMLGYETGEFDSDISEWRKLIHPKDSESVQKAMDDAIEGKGPFSIEMRMKDKAGEWHWILSRGGVVGIPGSGGGRVVGTHVDITELKNAESARVQAEQRYKEIFNNAPLGIFRTSFSGKIIDTNAAMVRILGYSSRDELMYSVNSIASDIYLNSDAREVFLNELKAHPNGLIQEIEFRRKDGSVVVGNMGASLQYDSEGNPDLIDGTFEDVTDKRAAQEALEINEMKFRTLYEVAQDSIVILEHGAIADVNPSFELLLNRKRPDIIGKSPADLSPLYQPQGRKSRDIEMEIFEKSRAGVSMLFDWVFLRSDGSHIFVETSLQQMDLQESFYQLAMIRDVTERRQSEQMMKQSEEKFSRLFMLSPDAIVLFKFDSKLIYDANKTFETIFGYHREGIIGRTLTDLGLFAEKRKFEAFLGRLSKSDFNSNFEAELVHQRGALISVSISSQIINIDENPYIIMVLHDVTEIKRMNEIMIQTEKMVSVGGIAAGIAHEINNPLGIVMQSAQNLERRLDPSFSKNIKTADSFGLDMQLFSEYVKERKLDVFVNDIKTASRRAADIIRNMLDFSRRSESNRVLSDITKLSDTAVELASNDYNLKKDYDFKRISIRREYAEGLPNVECTATEIEQVLLNLLRNSAQAMHNTASALPEIIIRISKVDDGLYIGIEDNGPGIPEKDIKQIFEPFYTTKNPGEGTGLGLSVSYFIITKGHNGRMWASSSDSGGAVFNIIIPIDSGMETENE